MSVVHRLYLFGVCLGIIALLGCCSPVDRNPTEVQDDHKLAGNDAQDNCPTITILADERSAEALAVVAQEIESELGIRAEIRTRPASDEGEYIVQSILATGEMADLFIYHTGSLFHALNPANTVLDITDEPFAEHLVREYREANTVDGRVYGVPISTTFSYVWAYNKEVYAQLGLDVPNTWQALMQNCKIIADSGKTPVLASYSSDWSAQIVLLSDYYNLKSIMPDFVNQYNANLAKYATTPAALRGFEKLSDIREFLNEDFLSANIPELLDRLALGEGAHYPMHSSFLNTIQENYPEHIESIGIFGQPGDDPETHGITLWMPYSLYIYKHSPNVDLAKEWLTYFVSQKGYDAYSSTSPPSGPYAVEGIALPADVPQGIMELESYLNMGKATVALEFETPLKGPNCAKICFETILGVMEPLAAAQAYDQDLEVQAIQLQLPGW